MTTTTTPGLLAGLRVLVVGAVPGAVSRRLELEGAVLPEVGDEPTPDAVLVGRGVAAEAEAGLVAHLAGLPGTAGRRVVLTATADPALHARLDRRLDGTGVALLRAGTPGVGSGGTGFGSIENAWETVLLLALPVRHDRVSSSSAARGLPGPTMSAVGPPTDGDAPASPSARRPHGRGSSVSR
ncbi:hypothetical protein GCM10009737_01300 [Nocardioides lentus]|uniref:Uncharacterized protein n=1 Tax=Nocardioides lentus TaxID=338077 RepID=A0ABP5A5H8_9ACTN